MAAIVVPAQKVIDACALTITRAMRERAMRDDARIAELMQPRSKLFDIFKRKSLTRDQAIDLAKEISACYFGGYPSCAYHDQLRHAKALLKLAAHGDPITLNEEDVSMIF